MNRFNLFVFAALIGLISLPGRAEGRFTVSPTEIHLEVADGGRGGMPVKITNTGDESITLKLSFGDSRFLSDGTEEDLLAGGHKRSCASWVLLNEQLLELKPGESEEIPIILEVPTGARGSFWSKLILEEVEGPLPGTGGEKGPAYRTFTRQRMGIRIFESVPGTTHRLAKIEDVMVRSITADELPVVHMQVKNVGNSLLHCRGWVELIDTDGAAVDTLLAGKSGRFSLFPDGFRILEATGDKNLVPGQYTALAIIDLGGDHLMAGDASFAVRGANTPFIAQANNPDMLDLLVEPIAVTEESFAEPMAEDLPLGEIVAEAAPVAEIELEEAAVEPPAGDSSPSIDESEAPIESVTDEEETPETDGIPEEEVEPAKIKVNPSFPGETGDTYTVQLKTTPTKQGAIDFIEALQTVFNEELYLVIEKPYFKIRAGRYGALTKARGLLNQAREFGFEGAWIVASHPPASEVEPETESMATLVAQKVEANEKIAEEEAAAPNEPADAVETPRPESIASAIESMADVDQGAPVDRIPATPVQIATAEFKSNLDELLHRSMPEVKPAAPQPDEVLQKTEPAAPQLDEVPEKTEQSIAEKQEAVPIADPVLPTTDDESDEAEVAVAALQVEEILPEKAPEPEAAGAAPKPGVDGWRVQVLSTKDLGVAEKTALEMMRKYEIPVRIDELPPYYAVRLGAFTDRESAILLKRWLISNGQKDVLIVGNRILTGQ